MRAKHALNRRDFNDAEALLQKAIEASPKSAEPHYLLGVLHEMRSEPHTAYGAYRAALLIEPNYEPAKFQIMKYYNDKLM
jgi:Tfp pilus assembly protein PilF